MDQGRPLEGARAHYDFLLTTVKCGESCENLIKSVLIEGSWVKVSCCRVARKFIKNGFLDAPLVHGLNIHISGGTVPIPESGLESESMKNFIVSIGIDHQYFLLE